MAFDNIRFANDSTFTLEARRPLTSVRRWQAAKVGDLAVPRRTSDSCPPGLRVVRVVLGEIRHHRRTILAVVEACQHRFQLLGEEHVLERNATHSNSDLGTVSEVRTQLQRDAAPELILVMSKASGKIDAVALAGSELLDGREPDSPGQI